MGAGGPVRNEGLWGGERAAGWSPEPGECGPIKSPGGWSPEPWGCVPVRIPVGWSPAA